jgi:lipoprotein-anchoring transpeptidase ErfK/SrfK
MLKKPFTRGDFIKLAGLSLGSIALGLQSPELGVERSGLLEFPNAERLGRVLGGKVEVKARPNDDSPTVKELFEDSVVIWLHEIVGSRVLWNHQRYVETPDGYIYSPNLQPVRNQPNQPLTTLPVPEGMWVIVTVPYVDLILANPPARSPWLEYTSTPRLYYSQVMWVDQIRIDDQGQTWYRVLEKYGSYGDIFWAAAEAFRPIQVDAISPIHPEVEEKLVVVDMTYQTMACYEGEEEVFFCQVSTGPKITSNGTSTKNDSDGKWATPPGKHTIWRKLVSVHMTGGTTGGGYDIPGIGWTTLFASKGMAIHSTFWHNSFGVPMSHGCVNALPEDAQWVFRWTAPEVPPDIGDITISGQGSTKVMVLAS